MNITKKKLLQRLFHIYPGEERNSLLFACLGFLWAFGVTCGLKFADALFIIHVGAEFLPNVYTLASFGMFVIAFVLLYSFDKYSPYSIYLTTLLIGIAFYCLVWICLFFNIKESLWFWYVLKLAAFFLFSVLMTCYWTFIDQYHHLQDAKRLYSLFSSMIFLGSASTGLIMRSGWLDLHHLILLIIGLLFSAYLWVRKIARQVAVVAHEDTEQEGQIYEQGSSFKFLIQSILKSPFTLLLMTSNFLTYLLLVTTEYNYMFTFENYFANQPLEGGGTEATLTLFLGQCLAAVSVSNLIFGIFIYSRLVRRFGISSLLIITPILLIVAFTGWSISESLAFPLIGFFVVEGTLYVIDDSNFNLLLNAVPTKLKYKIRVMIESFFEPVGMLISAILLSFFQSQSKLLGLILATVSLFIALILRSHYLKALFFNLSENAIHFQRTTKEWLFKMSFKQQKIAENRLLGILKLGDEKAQLFACEGLLSFEDEKILKKILSYASFLTPSAKINFISLLEQSCFAKNNLVLDTLQEWIQADYHVQLKSSVHFYLAKQGLLHPEKARADLKSPLIQLQGAAILSFKKSLAHLPSLTASSNRALAAQHLKLLLDSPLEEELCMGLQITGLEGDTNDINILISYLRHSSFQVARVAAQSLAQSNSIDSVRQVPAILAELAHINDHETRVSCLKALGQVDDSSLVYEMIRVSLHFRPSERRLIESIIYRMGLRTVPTLLSLTKDLKWSNRGRLLAGRILGRLALPQLRATLSDVIEQEIERAYFYFYHGQTIQKHYPNLDLTILKEVLVTNYHSVLDFIIQLLGVAGEVEDEELLSRSLRSPNPKVRSQVVETLEKTSEPTIFRLLHPLVADIPYEEKMRAYLKSGHKPLNLKQLLDKLGESSEQVNQIVAATMKYHLDLPNWRRDLRQQMSYQDEIFHHFAYELLES